MYGPRKSSSPRSYILKSDGQKIITTHSQYHALLALNKLPHKHKHVMLETWQNGKRVAVRHIT